MLTNAVAFTSVSKSSCGMPRIHQTVLAFLGQYHVTTDYDKELPVPWLPNAIGSMCFIGHLFIALPLIAEAPHAPAPCPITAWREVLAHQRFDLIRAEPVRCRYLSKADMIAQRHLNNFTYRRSIEIFVIAHVSVAMSG